MSRAINRSDVLAGLILLLLPLLLFWPVTLGPDTLLPVDNLFAYEPWLSYRDALGVGLPQNQLLSDLILENYAWKTFIRESIAAGQIPLWNPYILAGHPFLANGQHSALYPFTLLFYFLPLSKAYGWFTVSQLWLAGLNMYIFLRVLRANRVGALIAGLTFALSTFFIVSVVFTMIVAGAVWLPLLLAIIEIIIRKQEEKGLTGYSPIPYIVAGALVLGLQTLAGHVEITYYTLLVGGFYAACRLVMLWRKQATPRYALILGGWLLAMIGLGIGLGAVQLAPMYEVVTQNFRDNSVSLAQVRGWALPLRRIISFVIPDFFGSPAHHGYFDVVTRQWQPLGLNANGEINPLCPNCTTWDTKTAVEAGAYVGILPLVLAGLAVLQAAKAWLDDRPSEKVATGSPAAGPTCHSVFIFATLAVLSLLFAFGTPLYAILFYGLPGWNQLHSPFRWIFPFTLSIAVLAGLGVTYLDATVSAKWKAKAEAKAETKSYVLAQPSFLGSVVYFLGWGLFWSGLIGLVVMLVALVIPEPFIQAASFVFDRSGLAQNAFADGRQFFGYQWPNFFKFCLMVMAAGAVVRITRCPIFVSNRLSLQPRESNRLPAWQPLAVIIVAVDLLVAGAGFNPAVDPALLDFKPAVVQWLENQQVDDPFFRLSSFDTPAGPGNKLFQANAGMTSHLFDIRGYDSIIPGQYARFMQLIQENGDLLFNRIGPIYYDGYAALDSALLDLLGVRYILTTVDINNPNYELVYDQEIRVYENTDALPRAFVVHEEMPIGDDLDFALRSLNPRQQIILDGETNDLGRDLVPEDTAVAIPTASSVEISDYTPNEVQLTVRVNQPGWLVLADTYFPGWRAYAQLEPTTDRQPPTAELSTSHLSISPSPDRQSPPSEIELTIHRANGNFRAVYLQPGEWQVRFRYSPRSFQLGAYGSFLTAALLVFLVGYWAWGRLYRESEHDSPIKRVAKNSLVPMVMALSNRIIDLAFALLMLRILQPEGAGQFAFAVAFIGMVEIITRFGLGTLVTRDVAADRNQRNRYLTNASILRLYLWLAAIPVMAVILAMYVVWGDTTVEVLVTIAIFAVGTFFSNLSDGLTALFYAHEKAEYPAGVSAITTFVRVTVGALVLLLGWGIIGLAGASLVANLSSFAVLAYIMVTRIYRPHFEADPVLQREMMGESFPLMINHLLSTIFFRIDVFILKPVWGSAQVGYYSAAYKYIDGINVVPQYFTLAIFPLMSRFAADSRESLVRAYILSLRLLLLLAIPIAVGTPFVAKELILFLAGESFVPDSVIVLQLLIWFLPFSFINQVTQYVLIAINQQRQLTRAFIIGVLFNTVTNLIFIPLYGYRAAAITTILSEWSLLIPFYMMVRQNLCVVPWFDIVWRPAAAGLVMGLALWLVGDISFLATLALGSVMYLAALAALGGLAQQDMAALWRAVPLDKLTIRPRVKHR
ncbi:MAG: oligosaccharide flippase family protein [Anaerolineaceae bacterium]|nr:oligosaccharide flippase family protein [Anaerolineaceae bacterium]MCB9098916.1 oligosaccharide flippase family protein [Anaerolineales bacterium]